MATKLSDVTVASDGTWSVNDVEMTAGAKTVTLRRKSDGAVLATRSFTVEAASAGISLVGTPVAGIGAGANITLPSGRQAGDIILLLRGASSSVTGYTAKGPTGTSFSTYWRRATNDASDNVSVTNGVEYTCAIYRGCVASGDPFEAASASLASGDTTSGALSIAQITTATNGAWVIAAARGVDGGYNDGEGTEGSYANPAWASATGAATTYDGGAVWGGNPTSFGLAIYHSEKVTAGATGTCGVRFYMGTYHEWAPSSTTTYGALLALKPA